MRLTLATALSLTAGAALAQGLTPPGPPADTTLDLGDLQPRTVITALPFTAAQSGSYVLASDLTGVSGQVGITVAADHVAIDLQGFSLIGVPGSLDGIRAVSAQQDLTVRNGTVRDWGEDGIDGREPTASAINSHYEALRLVDNAGDGLVAGEGSVVRRCIASGNGATGFDLYDSTVASECVARTNAFGFFCRFYVALSGSTAQGNTVDGIQVQRGCVVSDCNASSNGDEGVEFLAGTGFGDNLVRDSVFVSNLDVGALFNSDSNRLENCVINNSATGIVINGDRNRVDGNTVQDHSVAGISTGTQAENNLIVRNSAENNATDYDIDDSDNTEGPTVSGSGTLNAGAWANWTP